MSVEILNASLDNHPNHGHSSIIRIALTLMLVLAPLGVWLSTTGNPVNYLHYDLPPGQLLYVISKLLGLYAVMLLWFQVMYGLLRNDKVYKQLLPAWSISSHRLTGLLVLAAAFSHFAVFFTAASIRKKEIMTHLLVPDFTHGFYTAIVSLGWVALVTMFIVVTAGLLRHKIGKHWLWVHRLSLVTITLVLLHSILIGSEARTVAWLFFYVLAGVTMVMAFIRRIKSNTY